MQRQPNFEGAATPQVLVRPASYKGLSSDELAHRLQEAEDELAAHQLQAAKRLSLHLNKRLMTLIQQWKDVQAQLGSTELDKASSGALHAKASKIATSITEQRRVVEEALQLMITLQPIGHMSPSPTMSLSAKARFQGTPVSTLKAVPVSDAWLQTLVQQDVRDPKLSIGAGPAQYWRFRFATLSDGSLAPKRPPTPNRRLKPVGVLKEGEAIAEDIRVAFATYDVDSSGDMDLKELEQALQHLGIETLPSGKFHPDAAEIMARYDTEGKGLGLGRIRLAEFNALCLDALAAGEELAKSGFTSDVIQLKVSDESSPSELLIEAIDAEGNVDTDFYSSTLLELDTEATEKHNGAAAAAAQEPRLLDLSAGTPVGRWMRPATRLHGLGFVKVSAGVGRAFISATEAGTVFLALHDGAASEPALSVLPKPPPLAIQFVSGHAVRMQLWASASECHTGAEVTVTAVLVDEHGNCVTSVNSGEVELEAASLLPSVSDPARPAIESELVGLGALAFVNGQASTRVSCKTAGELVIAVANVEGFPDAVPMMASHPKALLAASGGKPGAPKVAPPKSAAPGGGSVEAVFPTLRVRVLTCEPAEASIVVSPACSPLVAGRSVVLEVHLRDVYGNLSDDAAHYAQLSFLAVTIESGKPVERAYEITITDGGGAAAAAGGAAAKQKPPPGGAPATSGSTRRFVVNLQTESAPTPIRAWLVVRDGSRLPARLRHRKVDPCFVSVVPSEAASYVLSLAQPRLIEVADKAKLDAELEAADRAVQEREEAAAAAEKEKGEAEAEAEKRSALFAERAASLVASKQAEADAATKAAKAAVDAAAAEAEAAKAEAASKEAAEIAAQKAAAHKAAAEAAAAAKAAADAAAKEAADALAAMENASADEVEAAKAAAEGKDAAEAAANAMARARDDVSTAAADAASLKERADAAAAAEPLGVHAPVKLRVTAKDRFGNDVGASPVGDVSDVSLEVKGPARFAASTKVTSKDSDKLPKLALSEGIADFELLWNEDAKAPTPTPLGAGAKPRPMGSDGHGTLHVVAKSNGKGAAPKSGSEMQVTIRHSKPARVVLGARKGAPTEGWEGEGPDTLEALAGRPLTVPILIVDRFGCVCSHEDPRTIKLKMVGKTSGLVAFEEVQCTGGVGELIVSKTLAESVEFSISDDTRVLDPEEDAELSKRITENKMPLLKFFIVSTTVAFRHSTPCALQVLLEPVTLAANPNQSKPKPSTAPAALAAPTQPTPANAALPKDLSASTGDASAAAAVAPGPESPGKTGEQGETTAAAASGESGPAFERLDLGTTTKPTPEEPKAPPPLEVVAGSKLTGVVQAVDAFGNPATSAVWWKGRAVAEVIVEHEAVPKNEDRTLSGRGLLAFEKTPMRLPTTNGSVKHDVDLNDGVLKKVQTLKLVDGQVKLPINATIAGELRLSATLKDDAKNTGAGKLVLASGAVVANVTAAAAEMFDLVPLDQTGDGLRVMVHARDAYGNLDEACDREVLIEIDHHGSEPFLTVPNSGLVKLSGGVAELTGIRRREEGEQ